ncbi:MAG: dihydroorotase [Actinobacteria bacterium]|nr:MAG: dihydroorotase [Actinomycetota bacterium]
MSTPLVAPAGALPADLLVRQARVLDPRAGRDGEADVLVQGGEIAEIGASGALSPSPGTELIEGEGRTLLPAFFDCHVHLRTPGQEHKEDLDTGTRAAAAGGFCGVVAMPNTAPPVDSPELLRSLRETAAAQARVPVGFLAAITRELAGQELTDMAELSDLGALGFTDDGLPVVSAGVLRRAMQYQRLAGGVLALHEEDPALSAGGALHEGPVSALLGVRGVPSLAESTMVARDAALAAYEGARVHIQHVSCAQSLDAVAAAKADGGALTAEVTPHHLLLCEEDVRDLDPRVKTNPPLRGAEDRRALVEALRDGTLDCIATDHAPHAREDKEVPFEQAAMGTTGLETAFAALHTELVLGGALELGTLVERLTAGAAVMGLAMPRLAPGEPANLTLVDLEAEWQVGEEGYESRSENCCFAGRRVTGRVLLTVAGGAVAYRQRQFALSAA